MSEFKLGKMTFGSLFRKPETLLYPFETKPAPPGLKGHIVIDACACILCGMCQRTCPTGAITVDRPARQWNINRFQCVQCGSCVRACPKSCLTMDPHYPAPASHMSVEQIDIPDAKAAMQETAS